MNFEHEHIKEPEFIRHEPQFHVQSKHRDSLKISKTKIKQRGTTEHYEPPQGTDLQLEEFFSKPFLDFKTIIIPALFISLFLARKYI